MRYIDIEIYSLREQRYRIFEGLIDTGASICAISKHIADDLGLEIVGDKKHLWQVRDPLILKSALLNVRYEGEIYKDIETVIVDIPEQFRRDAFSSEECTRPLRANPLSMKVILGYTFFMKLSTQERNKLGIK